MVKRMVPHPFLKKQMNIFVGWKNIIKLVKTKKDLLARSSLFNKHLFWTNLGISFILSGVGDIFIQRYEVTHTDTHRDGKHSSKSLNNLNTFRWNPHRTSHMAVSFGFTSGFLCHFWYKYLDQKIPGNSIRIITRKILWDQIFFSPILIVACLAVAGVIDK